MRLYKFWVAIVILILNPGCQSRQNSQPVTESKVLTEAPVSVTAVKKELLTANLTFVGTIDANNVVDVAAETGGRVEVVLAKVGQVVSAGQTLVQVDDELAQSQLQGAEVNFNVAKRELERSERLFQEGSISAAQLDEKRMLLKQAEVAQTNARRTVNNTRITSPIGGTVDNRPVNIGTMVQPGMPVATIVDIATLKVRIRVSEREAFRLKTGDKVQITTDVYPGVSFDGRVDNIAAKADEAHTYRVEIVMPNSAANPLKAGMFARVTLDASSSVPVLTIPRAALVGSIKEPEIYVVINNKALLKPIVIGDESGDKLAVRDGLTEGDIIVTSGQNNLSNNAPVKIIGQ